MNVRRARFAAVSTFAAAALVVAGLTPAWADDPPLPVWDAVPTSSTVTDDYRIDLYLGTSTYSELSGREAAQPMPVFTFEIENFTDEELTLGIAMDLDTAGDLVPFWHESTWAHLGDSFDGLASDLIFRLAPGELRSGIDDPSLALPAWPGRSAALYEVTEVPAEPPAEGMTYIDGPLAASITFPGRFVPVRFGVDDAPFGVGIGSPTTVSAPDGELFPGVSATVTAENLVPGEELQMWLVDDLDYFWFYLSMAALPTDAVPVGPGTVDAEGTFTGTFVVPPDLPLSSHYQLLLGDADDYYWPAGSYQYFDITEPDSSASAPTSSGASTTTLTFPVTQVSLDFPAGTTAGTTTAAVSSTGPAPSGFTLPTDPPLYYHLSTTAAPGGPVTVCITYDIANIPGPAPYLYHHSVVPPSMSYQWTNITTSRVPGKVCGVTTSFSPFVLVIPDAPPDDGSVAVPAKGVLHSDNGWDTGLQDGDFNVVMNIWWGENARIVRLLENGTVIAEKTLTRNSPSAQQATFPISGRANGTYRYTAELENSRGVTTTAAVTVKVTDANPAKPVLSHDNWDNDGNFTVTANMWWGTNATSAQFYENGMPAGPAVALTSATPSAQVATLSRTGKAKGTYTYTVVFTNAAGATTSASLAVKVTK